MRSAAILLVVALSGPFARTAVAQPPADAHTEDQEARALFDRGAEAYQAGEFAVAIRYFRESYALSGRPQLLFNIATAADRLRRDVEALEHYRRFLAAVPDSPNRGNVEARIAAIERARAERVQPVEADDSGVASQWWFWTAIGGAVVLGVVLTLVIASSGGEEAIHAPDGNVMALRFP